MHAHVLERLVMPQATSEQRHTRSCPVPAPSMQATGAPDCLYLERTQRDITAEHRWLAVDWMVEVVEDLKLSQMT